MSFSENSDLPLHTRLEMARIDYLFGEPQIDGNAKRPLRNTGLLAKRYDLTPLQIAQQARNWLAELQVYVQLSNKQFAKTPLDDTIGSHENDVIFIREQSDLLLRRIKDLPPEALGSMEYDSLMSQYNKLQEKWSRLTGMDAIMRVREKTQSAIAAKEVEHHFERIKRNEEKALEDSEKPREVSGHIFDIGEVLPEE